MNPKKLRKLRKKRNLTQKEFANLLNISPSTVGMYEQGNREPNNTTLKKIANILEVSTDFLLDNYSSTKNEYEPIENNTFIDVLISIGYMKENENLTEKELEIILNFIKTNKKFIKKLSKLEK